jgi:spore coat polysaccharide biosynthesis protein SpsF (cytidylyltransferase family)
MDSSRFPGKVLRDLGGMPVIEHVLRRLERCGVFDSRIVLATTRRPCDAPLAECFAALGREVYLAPEDELANVAKRFSGAAQSLGAGYALRVNGDSPFPDPRLIRDAVAVLQSRTPDLVTNLMPRTYPYGISAELVRVAAMGENLRRLTAVQQEHVTAVFYDEPDRFQIAAVPACPWPWTGVRFTVDEPQDLSILERVIAQLPCGALDADLPTLIAAATAAGTAPTPDDFRSQQILT